MGNEQSKHELQQPYNRGRLQSSTTFKVHEDEHHREHVEVIPLSDNSPSKRITQADGNDVILHMKNPPNGTYAQTGLRNPTLRTETGPVVAGSTTRTVTASAPRVQTKEPSSGFCGCCDSRPAERSRTLAIEEEPLGCCSCCDCCAAKPKARAVVPATTRVQPPAVTTLTTTTVIEEPKIVVKEEPKVETTTTEYTTTTYNVIEEPKIVVKEEPKVETTSYTTRSYLTEEPKVETTTTKYTTTTYNVIEEPKIVVKEEPKVETTSYTTRSYLTEEPKVETTSYTTHSYLYMTEEPKIVVKEEPKVETTSYTTRSYLTEEPKVETTSYTTRSYLIEEPKVETTEYTWVTGPDGKPKRVTKAEAEEIERERLASYRTITTTTYQASDEGTYNPRAETKYTTTMIEEPKVETTEYTWISGPDGKPKRVTKAEADEIERERLTSYRTITTTTYEEPPAVDTEYTSYTTRSVTKSVDISVLRDVDLDTTQYTYIVGDDNQPKRVTIEEAEKYRESQRQSRLLITDESVDPTSYTYVSGPDGKPMKVTVEEAAAMKKAQEQSHVSVVTRSINVTEAPSTTEDTSAYTYVLVDGVPKRMRKDEAEEYKREAKQLSARAASSRLPDTTTTTTTTTTTAAETAPTSDDGTTVTSARRALRRRIAEATTIGDEEL